MKYVVNTELEIEGNISMKEMVQRSGLSEHTLRYYEKIKLLAPIARDESSGHRHYDESDVVRVITLACLRATGMSIDQMRRYFLQNDIGEEAAADQIDLFESHRDTLLKQMDRVQHQLDYLDGKLIYWRATARGDVEAATAQGWRNVEMALEINQEMKEDRP